MEDKRGRGKKKETERQTQRQKDRQIQSNKETGGNHLYRPMDLGGYREGEKGEKREGLERGGKEREGDRQTDREEGLTEREAERERDIETDGHREGGRERGRDETYQIHGHMDIICDLFSL